MDTASKSHRRQHALITGGAGYLGSHMCAVLAQQGHAVTILDNFSNSTPDVVARLRRLAAAPIEVIDADLRDEAAIASVLRNTRIDAVYHFAGLKSVAESVRAPLDYFSNNVAGSLVLLRQMAASRVRTLVFSSSATVYGGAADSPIPEEAATAVASPYGRSKLAVEGMLADMAAADPSWRIACLRYFNPVGAHPSGMLGEKPMGEPSNLMPYVVEVAAGRRAALPVYGNDYPTRDGTGVRDYIHVMDLVEGHLAALAYLADGDEGRFITLNLGTGRGVTVLELVRAFEAATGCTVPLQVMARRPGDVAECFADARRARNILGWSATRSLEEMCRSSWRWSQTFSLGHALHHD